MGKPTSLKLRRPGRIQLPSAVRCSDCNGKYEVGDRFPQQTRFEVAGMSHLTLEDREDIFKNLAISLSGFSDYVYLKYQLDIEKIDIDVDLEVIPESKVSEA
jgi:hypothetical protein